MSDIKAKLNAVEVLRGTPSIGKGEKGDKGDKGDTGDITPEAQAALASAQQAAEAAKTSAQQAEAAAKSIPEIEIGGRNLLIGSENCKFANYSGTTSTTEEFITVAEWGATDARRVYGTSGTSDLAMLITTQLSSDPRFLPNQDYVGSIYIKNNHATTAITFCRQTPQGYDTVNPGESKRVSFLYNPGSQTGILMQIQARCPAGSEFDFTYWHPQWEIGNKTTDWTPAPEDKQDTITGAGSTVTSSNLTKNRALISNGSGKIGVASVTATELGYLSGATSNLQSQLDQVNRDITAANANITSAQTRAAATAPAKTIWQESGVDLNVYIDKGLDRAVLMICASDGTVSYYPVTWTAATTSMQSLTEIKLGSRSQSAGYAKDSVDGRYRVKIGSNTSVSRGIMVMICDTSASFVG